MEWGSSRRKSRRPFRNLCASVFRKSAPWSSTETGRRWEGPAREAQLEEFARQHGKARRSAPRVLSRLLRVCEEVRPHPSIAAGYEHVSYRFHSLFHAVH